MTWAYVCGIVVCIIFSHIFSSAEMSYSSCNRMRLENARDDGSKRAKVAVKIVDNFDDSLSAILIGNNLANIANSSLGSLLVLELCNGDDSYAWVSTLTITILVIIFGETIPKIIAKSSANRLALTYAYFVRGLTIIFMPLIRLVVGLIKLLTLGLKGEAEDTDEEAAVEELSSRCFTPCGTIAPTAVTLRKRAPRCGQTGESRCRRLAMRACPMRFPRNLRSLTATGS